MVGNDHLDPQRERFEAVAGGVWSELLQEFEVHGSFTLSLAPSPARRSWEADCVEERHKELGEEN